MCGFEVQEGDIRQIEKKAVHDSNIANRSFLSEQGKMVCKTTGFPSL